MDPGITADKHVHEHCPERRICRSLWQTANSHQNHDVFIVCPKYAERKKKKPCTLEDSRLGKHKRFQAESSKTALFKEPYMIIF